MPLRLVKTVGGQNGAPENCPCGSKNFVKSSVSWSCGECGKYVPANLNLNDVQKSLKELEAQKLRFKLAIEDLEKIVK